LSSAHAQSAPPTPPHHHLVRVHIANRGQLAVLLALDLDLAGCCAVQPPPNTFEVIATDADLGTLARSGLAHDVAIVNLEQHHARELAASPPPPALANSTLTPPLGQGSMGGHYTLDEIVANLDAFARTFPAICAPKVSIGRSLEGRDIWMVKISDNVGVDENEPEVYYDALHHAREPLSMETTLLFMDTLLSRYASGDPDIEYLVNERELFFVPCVNPDGYEYNRSTNPGGGGMWRKNRRGGYGVDLNRNYPTAFGGAGSSGSQTSETYRGTAPFSEPETAAIDAFVRSRSFVQAFSTHTYTDVLLRPWAYQTGGPPNAAVYDRVGRAATARNGIQHGSWFQLLYQAAGTATDHHHVGYGSMGWTAELGRADEGGFWPNPTNTVAIATRHQHMFTMIALLSGPALTDAEIIMMASGRLGTAAKVGMLGTPGAFASLGVSTGTANLPIPGIIGNLLLDPSLLVVLPPVVFGASGYTDAMFTIPNNGGLRGTTTYWQLLHASGVLRLGNRQALAFS
jgi:murein tripeptide amidase MpaA